MDIPQQLEKNLKCGKVIPFVGAGVSMTVLAQSGESLFPSWKALLMAAADRLEKEKKVDDMTLVRSLVNKGRLLEAAKEAQLGLGANWYDFLISQFDKTSDEAQDASLELARLVWRLGSNLIITTNYDNVLHWACPQLSDLTKWNIEAAVEQCNLMRNGVKKSTIWHLHGHIGDSANIILTPDGYQRLYADDSTEKRYVAAIQTLHHQLATHSFLFIGFSLADEDFTDQLRMLEEVYQGAAGPHYVLLPEAQRDHFKSPTSAIEPVFFQSFGEPLLNCLRHMTGIVGSTVKSMPTANTTVADYSPDKPVFYVPFRAKGEQMVGRRDALEKVRNQLCEGKRTYIGQAVAFQGLGGLGKTQLAVEYAYAYRSEYPNGVIWINADQDIIAQLIKLAEEARWVSPLSEQSFKIQTARQRLREVSGCLIVFDNLEQLADIEELLPKAQTNSHILVTSRVEQEGFNPVSLDILTSELGLQLLVQEAGRKLEDEEDIQAAKAIVERLDGLPLALELAGAYLRRRHDAVSWKQYLELLRDNPRSAFPARLQKESLTHHEADIYATLKINETLFEEEPLLQEVLDLLTWSGSAPMALSLLCATLGQDKPSVLTEALSLGVTLRILRQSDGGERYAIHRLVREVRREDVLLEMRRHWAEGCGYRLSDWFEKHRQEFCDLPIFEAGLDHLEAWRHNAESMGLTLQVVRMMWLQAYPAYHWGHYEGIKRDLERALALYEQASQLNPALQAHLFNDLTYVNEMMGNYKVALNLGEQALAIRRELYGEEHPDTVLSLCNIASCHSGLGAHEKALEIGFLPALDIQRKRFGEEHPDTANSLSSIALCYRELGQYDKALEIAQQALTIRRKLFGEEHPDTATSLNNIATILSDLCKYNESLELGLQSLAISQKLLGDAHPSTIFSEYNVILRLCNVGRKTVAIQRFNAQFKRMKSGDLQYQRFLELRANLFPGSFRKPTHKSGKGKRRC
jgi:tetratricopeptide (TPR) repeat protein